MNTNIVKVRFGADNNFGKEYSYFTPEIVAVGDNVVIEIRGDRTVLGTVSEINVSEAIMALYIDRAKTIIGKYVEEVKDPCISGPGCECDVKEEVQSENK